MVAALLFATACGAATPGGEAPATAHTTPTSTAAAGADASEAQRAASAFTPRAVEAVVGPAEGESFVNPGGVVHHDGKFHMLRNSFTTFPGPASTTYLTSEDGIDWQQVGTEPVLSTADVPYADDDSTVFMMSLLPDGGDSWVAYLYTYDGDLNPGVIGRATAPSPAGPWTVDATPVLEPGVEGAWDERRVAEPSVVRTDDGWRMLYAGFGADRMAQVGLATSDDGVRWQRHDGPVLEGVGQWDGGAVGSPNVVVASDGALLMVYDNAVRGQYGLGLARSDDGGLTWEPSPGNPHLTPEDTAESQFFQTELVRGPDGLQLLLEAGNGRRATSVYAYDVAD